MVPPRCPSGRGRLNHYRGLGSVGRCSADRSAGARARNDTLSSGCLVCRRVGLRCARRGSRPACHLQSARLVAPVRRRTPGLAVRDLRYAARPDIRRETLHGRDGVIRFQHRRKISSLLIRDTVAPIANRTTSGSCLAIETLSHRKPGVVVSNHPAGRSKTLRTAVGRSIFPRGLESVTPRNPRPERASQQIVAA